MAEKYHAYTLVGAIMKRSHLSWYWATAVIAAMLILLLILVTYLDGVLANLLEWGFWQNHIEGPILITYILMAYPFMWRLRERAIQTFRPLLSLDDEAFNRMVVKLSTPNRRWEWGAVLLGVALAFAIGQPWNLGWGSGELWLSVYLVIIGMIFNGLLYWLIYDTLTGTVRLARLSRQQLKLDIMETDLLTPIAQWSLGISLAFIGGTSLSLLNKTWESLLHWDNILTYSILICVIVLVFFLSMWSAHNAIANVKKRELALARKHLMAISHELKKRAAKGQLKRTEGLSSTISLWATYQKLVQETPTWPFNANIIRRLIASIVVPVFVYLIKIIAGLGIRF
ncbi:hypothetical protein ACFLWD_03200 [Chloroflexota bacterium]